MNKVQVLAAAFIVLFLSETSWAHQRGVTELSEGNVRKIYVNKPLVGTNGYVVGDWENGQVRFEMFNLPTSNTGYEIFLFEINIRGFVNKMFVNGVKDNGVIANPPLFKEVGGLIKQWYSLGDSRWAKSLSRLGFAQHQIPKTQKELMDYVLEGQIIVV